MTRTLKPRPTQTEYQLHVAVRAFLSIAIAHPGRLSRDKVAWYSICPEGATSAQYGNAKVLKGAVSGCPDLDFYYQERAFKIELKLPRKSSKTFDDQDALHDVLRGAGVKVAVCRSVAGVQETLRHWQIPMVNVQL